jgi:hypothetical protein
MTYKFIRSIFANNLQTDTRRTSLDPNHPPAIGRVAREPRRCDRLPPRRLRSAREWLRLHDDSLGCVTLRTFPSLAGFQTGTRLPARIRRPAVPSTSQSRHRMSNSTINLFVLDQPKSGIVAAFAKDAVLSGFGLLQLNCERGRERM